MDEARARKILGNAVRANGDLDTLIADYPKPDYTAWAVGSEWVSLDGSFTVDELEAVVWWMRNTIAQENPK